MTRSDEMSYRRKANAGSGRGFTLIVIFSVVLVMLRNLNSLLTGVERKSLELIMVSDLEGTVPMDDDTIAVADDDALAFGMEDEEDPALCRRPCSSRRNKIVIGHLLVGLGSASGTLHGWTHVAGALCATVHARSPRYTLTQKHNHDLLGLAAARTLDRELRWIDLDNFTYSHEEDARALYDYDAKDIRDAVGPSSDPNRTFVTTSKEEFEDHFKRAEALSFDGTDEPFVWYIGHVNYFALKSGWDRLLAERNRTGGGSAFGSLTPTQMPGALGGPCMYGTRTEPELLTRLVRAVRGRLREEATSVGLLHLRRGDSKESCDTSIATLQKYVRCTFAAGRRPTLLAVASDETDLRYRKEVMGVLDSVPGVRGVDLDGLVWRTIVDESDAGWLPRSYRNNYHVYKVTYRFFRDPELYDIDFVLHRRRSIVCNDCDADILEQVGMPR